MVVCCVINKCMYFGGFFKVGGFVNGVFCYFGFCSCDCVFVGLCFKFDGFFLFFKDNFIG